jgi:hypothetical protein
MNNQLVAIVANIVAAQARIEGMKAKNTERESQGYALAYDEDAFFAEANQLDQLSIEARNAS